MSEVNDSNDHFDNESYFWETNYDAHLRKRLPSAYYPALFLMFLGPFAIGFVVGACI